MSEHVSLHCRLPYCYCRSLKSSLQAIHPFICLLSSMHLIRRIYLPWTVCLDYIKLRSLHISTHQVTTYPHNQTPAASLASQQLSLCCLCIIVRTCANSPKRLLFWAKCATISAFVLSVYVCCLFKCAGLVCFMDGETVNTLHAIHEGTRALEKVKSN